MLVDAALKEMSPVFQRLYSRIGRPSIPPEKLIRASVLQMLYTIRSERQLMEQLDFNILYRWFVGLGMDDRVWDPTVYTKNRARLLRGQVDVRFFEAILEQAREKGLLSEEHFTVDGTLIEAWASQKSFQPKDARSRRRTTRAIPASTSAARSGRTRRTSPRPIRRRGCFARRAGTKRSCATWAMC